MCYVAGRSQRALRTILWECWCPIYRQLHAISEKIELVGDWLRPSSCQTRCSLRGPVQASTQGNTVNPNAAWVYPLHCWSWPTRRLESASFLYTNTMRWWISLLCMPCPPFIANRLSNPDRDSHLPSLICTLSMTPVKGLIPFTCGEQHLCLLRSSRPLVYISLVFPVVVSL